MSWPTIFPVPCASHAALGIRLHDLGMRRHDPDDPREPHGVQAAVGQCGRAWYFYHADRNRHPQRVLEKRPLALSSRASRFDMRKANTMPELHATMSAAPLN